MLLRSPGLFDLSPSTECPDLAAARSGQGQAVQFKKGFLRARSVRRLTARKCLQMSEKWVAQTIIARAVSESAELAAHGRDTTTGLAG